MQPIPIPLGEWLPDLPDYQNPGALTAKNVIPAGMSYAPFLSQEVYSNALDARCQGAISTKDSDGNTVNFAGDVSKLYRSASGSYADVSKVGGYSTSSEEMWYFTRFNNFLLATNFGDAIQKFTVNSSSNFSDLSATAPKARYISTIRSFVVVGNTFDGVDGNVPNRVRWSALDDATSWTVSSTTQSDYQDLDVSKGWVRQVVGGEYGVIFQERAISRMTYAGSPTIWQFDEVESGKGTQAPGSVVKVGNLIFYLGLDGFYVFDGNQSIPIGANKIDKTFFNEVDLSYLTRISATADVDRQIVYWAVPTSGNTSGRPNTIYCYNYSPSSKLRWSRIEGLDFEFLYTSLSEGYTLDSLDTVNSNLDALTPTLDSRIWTGENFILSGFDSSHRQINFTGAAMDATVDTTEFQLAPGNRSDITCVRPLVDGATSTVTVQMGTRDTHGASNAFGTASGTNGSGECPVRSNSRYHRGRINIAGGFNHAQGLEIVEAAKVGRR
jgi:hypothetical protein